MKNQLYDFKLISQILSVVLITRMKLASLVSNWKHVGNNHAAEIYYFNGVLFFYMETYDLPGTRIEHNFSEPKGCWDFPQPSS